MPKTSRSKGATENVRVVVRLRPLNQTETDAGDEEVVRIGSDKTTLQVLLPNDEDFQGNSRQTVKKFALDGCFEENTTQPQCFENSGVTALLDSALEGFSATVFAYGQTGSGKTYTMAGKLNDNDWDGTSPAKFDGIIPRSVRYIFQQVEARRCVLSHLVQSCTPSRLHCCGHSRDRTSMVLACHSSSLVAACAQGLCQVHDPRVLPRDLQRAGPGPLEPVVRLPLDPGVPAGVLARILRGGLVHLRVHEHRRHALHAV